MGLRNFIANKLFDIDGTVNKQVDSAIDNIFTYKIPGKEYSQDLLLKYRQGEYEVWARDNAVEISKFYNTYKIQPNELTTQSRQLFWEWANPIDNIPKVHFPTPNIIMGQMKSLLFSEELTIDIKTGNMKLDENLNQELKDIYNDNNAYELFQDGSTLETYSGTLGARLIVNTDYEEYPITKMYPAERIKFKEYMGRVQEIIFLDNYIENKKTYTLRSIYGKGYIRYELTDHRGKEVSLNTVEDTKDLKNMIFLDSEGNPIKVLMAVYKKNRATSAEFPDTPYGGSDFEGLTDTFQMIDELYSTRALYIRRTRPTQTLSEDRVVWDDKNKVRIIPPEYKQDTIILAANKNINENGFTRDIQTVDFSPYMEAIKDELKTVWMKIGMSYTSVGLEAHSANISNAALLTKEKSTVIVRANKEKLWKKFLKDYSRLNLIYNSLKNIDDVYEIDDTVYYTLPNTFDYNYTIEFPPYASQSFEERLDVLIKGMNGELIDHEEAVNRLYKDEYTEEEKAVRLYKTKIENSITLFDEDIPEGYEMEEEEPVEEEVIEDEVIEEEETEEQEE